MSDENSCLAAALAVVDPRYQFMVFEILGEVLEGSGADTLLGSGGFRCRYLLPCCRVPVQVVSLASGGLRLEKKLNKAGAFELLEIAPVFFDSFLRFGCV